MANGSLPAIDSNLTKSGCFFFAAFRERLEAQGEFNVVLAAPD
jgi:hypothetical protein